MYSPAEGLHKILWRMKKKILFFVFFRWKEKRAGKREREGERGAQIPPLSFDP